MLSKDLNGAIQKSLEDMGKISGASRAYIFQFNDDFQLMSNTHEWCSESVVSEKDMLQNMPTSDFPWWMHKLRNNEIILIPKVSEMPPDASSEKEILESQDILSLIVLPLFVNHVLFGFIGLDNVKHANAWDADDLTLLRVSSEIFGNAFHRLQTEEQLIESNKRLTENLEEIKRLQSQLIQQEKIVGIGQLAAGIAHEINNPLGFVTSNYEVLYRYTKHIQELLTPMKQLLDHSALPDSNTERCTYLDDIRTIWEKNRIDMVLADMTELLEDSKIGFDRVSEIVSSLRNFAHIDQNDTKDYEDIHDILDEVLLILNNEIKYIATIDRQYGEVPQIYCHRGQLGQVFINLLMNAVHAIKAAKDHEMGTLTLETWLDNEFQQVCARISDDGCGIPAEVLPFIFNPFYTTKAVGEGTGLGLSISYDIIVNKHNGTIHVESTVGKGTQFTIRLPY